MTHKDRDTAQIIEYLLNNSDSDISLADIEQYSGAERLRVFPITYELYLQGKLHPVHYSFWGVPTGYRVVDKELKDF